MAVIVADRKEGKLEVLERISELYDYSSQLCQSEKSYKITSKPTKHWRVLK